MLRSCLIWRGNGWQVGGLRDLVAGDFFELREGEVWITGGDRCYRAIADAAPDGSGDWRVEAERASFGLDAPEPDPGPAPEFFFEDGAALGRAAEGLERRRAALVLEVDQALRRERQQLRLELGVDGEDRELVQEARDWKAARQADPSAPEPPAGTYPLLEGERDAYVDAGRVLDLEQVAGRVLQAARNSRGRAGELRRRETELRLRLEGATTGAELDQVAAALRAGA